MSRRTKTGGSRFRYQGISLSAYQCSIMRILEQLVDQPIPHTAELDHDFFGFVAKYPHVIELSLSRAYEKQEILPLELPRDFGLGGAFITHFLNNFYIVVIAILFMEESRSFQVLLEIIAISIALVSLLPVLALIQEYLAKKQKD